MLWCTAVTSRKFSCSGNVLRSGKVLVYLRLSGWFYALPH